MSRPAGVRPGDRSHRTARGSCLARTIADLRQVVLEVKHVVVHQVVERGRLVG